MIITLIPIRADDRLALRRRGDTLILNGEALDLSPLTEGAVLPRAAIASPWIAGDVTRQGGVLHLSVLFPHGPDAAPEARFPAPLHLTGDGDVALPAAWPAPAQMETFA
jgi:hypothetical protein